MGQALGPSGRSVRPAMGKAWILLRRAPLSAKIGLAIVALNLIAALLAPLLAPHGETAVVGGVWVGGFWAADFSGRFNNRRCRAFCTAI